ncbi:nitrilase family protein [Ruicaihuangia caeni]|uniref:Nitrilase family protein n=1 Tax=Ruicaihuangia caeni TaxID=3042517 RepID=A0AAW6T754_9MICO|nr:nitrilase family protein [Klugiella sp. YN-L-19]MDI2099637.1 nitrilase family protein [Klugiella sp. YN-L-19]
MTTSTAFTIACAQTDPVIGDLDANREMTVAAIHEAADGGAKLVVLPECATGGWAFTGMDESLAAAESVVDGPTIAAWKAAARERDIWVCGGFGELADDTVYNSAVLISPDGVESVYRKVHLWNTENNAFTPGNLGFPVVDTPLGRIGMIICYDAWFPESMRSCALQGADLVLAPSDWVPNPGQQDMPSLANMMTIAGAHSNQVYVAAASRVGVERGQRFIGESVIAGHDGWLLAGPAPAHEAIIFAEIDPIGSRQERRDNIFNRPLGDRRPEAYAQG